LTLLYRIDIYFRQCSSLEESVAKTIKIRRKNISCTWLWFCFEVWNGVFPIISTLIVESSIFTSSLKFSGLSLRQSLFLRQIFGTEITRYRVHHGFGQAWHKLTYVIFDQIMVTSEISNFATRGLVKVTCGRVRARVVDFCQVRLG